MPVHPEHERTRGAPDDEEESPEQSKAGLMGEKLKAVAHYLMRGFAPALALIALIVAVVAIADKRSGDSRMNEVIAELQNMNANLTATRSELESLKFLMTRQKSQQDAEKKQEELNAKIVRNVTRLQEKMKVSPTLEEQLHQAASAPVAAVPSGTAAAIVPEKAAAKDAAPTAPVKEPAKAPEQKAAPKAAAPATNKKQTPAQLQAIKEAIEKFNRQ